MEFSKYAQTAKTINGQQTDYDFMVKRATNACSA